MLLLDEVSEVLYRHMRIHGAELWQQCLGMMFYYADKLEPEARQELFGESMGLAMDLFKAQDERRAAAAEKPRRSLPAGFRVIEGGAR